MLSYIIILALSIFSASTSTEQIPLNPYSSQLDTLSDSARVNFIIDHFYEIYSNNLNVALTLSQYATKVAEANHWKDKEAYARMFQGLSYYLKADYTAALPLFLRANDLFDSTRNYKGQARLYNELAVFYRKQDDIEKMVAYLDKGESAAIKINDLSALSTNYHHRGTIYSRKGEFDKALPYFEKVLKIREELRDSIGLGYIYLDLAEYHMNKNNQQQAISFIEKSTAIRQKMGDIQGVAINEVSMGEMYFANRQYEKAIPYFIKTINTAKSIGFSDLIRFAYDKLQKCYMEQQNFQKAYEALSKCQILTDSIFNLEKTRVISEMQIKYETEKKEQQIDLQQLQLAQKDAQLEINRLLIGLMLILVLSLLVIGTLQRKKLILKREKLLEKEKRKAREMEIKAALASQEQERSRVARDLHDGFGQMISILNLNLKSLEKKQVDRHQVFEQSAKVLEDMYQELKGICFNLMPQTLIKNGITSAINEFAARVSQTGKLQVRTDFFGLDERLTEMQEISLYRITQEWINNMLKYSDADQADIQITKDDQEITLLIEDNGIGFDSAMLTSGKGNGWRNMNSRANLIKGELVIDTLLGTRGSTLIVNAPTNMHIEKMLVQV